MLKQFDIKTQNIYITVIDGVIYKQTTVVLTTEGDIVDVIVWNDILANNSHISNLR